MRNMKKAVASAVIIGIFIYVFNFEYFGYFLGLICNSAMECVTGGDECSNQLAEEMETLKVSKFISLKVNGKEIDLDNTDFGEDFYNDIVVENEEEHIPDEDLLLKAEKARNELIIKTPGGNTKSMAIGAYDIKTGAVAADFAGPIPEKISDVLIERARKIGGIGSTGLTDRNIVGVCAEFRVANQLLLNKSDIANIRFTAPIRPRTGEIRPNCKNCLEIFSDILD